MAIKIKPVSSVFIIIFLIIFLMCPFFIPWLSAVEVGLKMGERLKVEVQQPRIAEKSPRPGLSEELSMEKGIALQREERGGIYGEIIGFFKIVAWVGIIGGILGVIGYFLYSFDRRIKKMQRTLGNIQVGSLREMSRKEDADRYWPQPSIATEDANFIREIPSMKQRTEGLEKQFDSLNREYIRISVELRELQNRSRAVWEIIPLFAGFFNSIQEIGRKIAELEKGNISYSQEKAMEVLKPPKEPIVTKKDISEKDLVKWWDKSGNQLLGKCRKAIEEEFKDAASEVISTTEHDKEDWRLIGIKSVRENFYYVLPRKYSFWSPLFQKWFELEETGYMDRRILSIFIPLPKAKKDNYDRWELLDKKGRVSIKEA